MEVTKWLEPDDEFRALVEKAPDADILRETIAFAAGRLMEVDVGDRTDAPKWGRFARPARPAQRLSQPGLGDAAGTVELPTLKLRRAPIFRAFSDAAADQPGQRRYCAPCGGGSGGSHFYYRSYLKYTN